jgi:hypothetical protein
MKVNITGLQHAKVTEEKLPMTVDTVTQVIHDTTVPYLGIPIGNNFMVAQL